MMVMTTVAAFKLRLSKTMSAINWDRLINTYAVIGFTLSTEILFRTYSDTYLNFLIPGLTNLWASISILVALILFLIIYKFRKTPTNQMAMFTIVYTVGAAVLAIVARSYPLRSYS